MRPDQRSRSRSRASQRSGEAGDTQPQASKAPSGDGELQAGPPPSRPAAKPTGSRPRWRQGTLPEAPGAAPEDKDKEGTTQPEPQREDKKGATQPEREDTEQEPQTERGDKDTQEKPEAPEEAPEDPEDPEEEQETQPEDPEEVVPDSQPPFEDSAELRAWQRSARRASASLQSRWELDSQL